MNTEYINAETISQENNRINDKILNEDDQYDPNLLSKQQLSSGKEILSNFNKYDIRWQILLAQMQSGKTETFLFVAAEMIRRGMVENVVIFSGNAEIDLKIQLINIVKEVIENEEDISFYDKYTIYLRNQGLEEDERRNIIRKIKSQSRINVVWGAELKNYSGPYENTLFIWEEAHYAQTIGQGPDKFLQEIGISANGDKDLLGKKSNYVVSISATPFSELCNYYKTIQDKTPQDKKVVVMEPGNNYNSVEKMLENNRIKFYSSIEEGLTEALNTPRERMGNKFAIVRINKNEEEIKTIIKRNNWHYETFDSISSKEEQKNGDKIWKSMKKSPDRDTVILIRNKCRMGKNLPKNHLLFCFETAIDSKTDTVLQGLLGRLCGYSTNSENVDIYLSKQIEKDGELIRYIKMTHDLKTQEIEEFEEFEEFELNPTIPKKAKNVKNSGSGHKTSPIIIMKIKNGEHNNYNKYNDDGLNKKDINCAIQTDIKNAFNTDNVENNNTEQDTQDIKCVINNSDTKWQFHSITGNEDTFKNVPEKIENSIKCRTPFSRDGGCGFKSANKLQVNVWIIKIATGNLQQGALYIDCFIKNNNEIQIPNTTKNEVFSNNLLEDNNLNRNSTFKNSVVKELSTSYTSTSVEEMLRELIQVITYTTNNCVHAIDVTEEVLEGLQKNGTIFNYIQEKYQKTLKITKPRGRIPSNIKDKGMVRLKTISW